MIILYFLSIPGNQWVSLFNIKSNKILLRINNRLPFGSLPSASDWLFHATNIFSDSVLKTSELNYKSRPCSWAVSNLIKETQCAIKVTFDESRYWFGNLLWWYLWLLLTEIFPASQWLVILALPCGSMCLWIPPSRHFPNSIGKANNFFAVWSCLILWQSHLWTLHELPHNQRSESPRN